MFHVEREKPLKNSRLWLTALQSAVFLVCAHCHKPLPNPESLDHIYSDLRSEEEKGEKEVTELQAKVEEDRKTLEKMTPLDLERRHSQAALAADQGKLARAKQNAQYYRLRAESRRAEDLDSYARVFGTDAEKSWPPDDEQKLYATQKRLESAPRHWKTVSPASVLSGNSPLAKSSKSGEKPKGEKAPAGEKE